MTTAKFRAALVFSCLFCGAHAFAAEDSVFKEAQVAVLNTLDLPRGISGKQTLHIRLKSKGEKVTYELWNAKLHMRLSKAAELSVADKLNGQIQALWKGDAILTARAYRVLTNPESVESGELKQQRWKETPSTFGNDALLGFSLLNTAQGWKVNPTKRGAKSSTELPYDNVISLFTEPAESPASACSEKEVEMEFRQLIHSQTADGFVLVERTLPSFADFINEDKHHEFDTPSLQFEMLPLTAAQVLNGDALAIVRVACQAHRFPKTIKSKTAKTPQTLSKTNEMWKGEDAGLKWKSGPSPDKMQKGDCDFVGVRKDGIWTFTTSAFLLNPVWLEKVVLITQEKLPTPEDELPVTAR